MGVLFIAATFVDRLNREWHVDALLARAGKGGPIVAGAAFSIAWTPCIGPALGGILTLAGIQGEAAHGAFLLAVYSLGPRDPVPAHRARLLAGDHRVRGRSSATTARSSASAAGS